MDSEDSMDSDRSTCWSLVDAAARGLRSERDELARRYLPVVETYLRARWRGTRWIGEVEDAVQEFFVECFRAEGFLARVDPARPGGFRAYLFGAVRNVARRFEERERHGRREAVVGSGRELEALEGRDDRLSRAFDRAWARALVRRALAAMRERADAAGADAVRRVEILALRFEDGLPIRAIAERHGDDAERVHREYARARREFKSALLEVVAAHSRAGAAPAEVEAECRALLELLRR